VSRPLRYLVPTLDAYVRRQRAEQRAILADLRVKLEITRQNTATQPTYDQEIAQ